MPDNTPRSRSLPPHSPERQHRGDVQEGTPKSQRSRSSLREITPTLGASAPNTSDLIRQIAADTQIFGLNVGSSSELPHRGQEQQEVDPNIDLDLEQPYRGRLGSTSSERFSLDVESSLREHERARIQASVQRVEHLRTPEREELLEEVWKDWVETRAKHFSAQVSEYCQGMTSTEMSARYDELVANPEQREKTILSLKQQDREYSLWIELRMQVWESTETNEFISSNIHFRIYEAESDPQLFINLIKLHNQYTISTDKTSQSTIELTRSIMQYAREWTQASWQFIEELAQTRGQAAGEWIQARLQAAGELAQAGAEELDRQTRFPGRLDF